MNRDELFASVLEDINREDKASYLPEWLTSGVFRINRISRLDEQVKRAVTNLTETLVSPPNDFIAPKQIRLLQGSGSTPGTPAGELAFMPVGVFDSGDYKAQNTPTFYTQRGMLLEFIGWTGAGPWQIDLRYYANWPVLSEGTSSNWLLANAPHIYKDAMKYFAFQHLQEFVTADQHLARMTQEIEFLNEKAKENKYSSDGGLYMRPPRKLGGRHS